MTGEELMLAHATQAHIDVLQKAQQELVDGTDLQEITNKLITSIERFKRIVMDFDIREYKETIRS